MVACQLAAALSVAGQWWGRVGGRGTREVESGQKGPGIPSTGDGKLFASVNNGKDTAWHCHRISDRRDTEQRNPERSA